MSCLHALSDLGVNVVATLHQPRQEIFDMVNSLCLLAPGGRTMYMGPAFGLKDYLFRQGFRCPVGTNVADFAMDVVAGYVVPIYSKTVPPVSEIIKTLCDYYAGNYYETFKTNLEHELSTTVQSGENRKSFLQDTNELQVSKNEVDRDNVKSLVKSSKILDLLTVFFVCTYTCFRRQISLYYNQWNVLVKTSMLLYVLAVIIALLMGDIASFDGPLYSQILGSQLVFAIVVVNSSINLFSSDTLVRNREEEGDFKLLPLVLGKILASFVETTIYPLAYTCSYFGIVKPMGSFEQYWYTFILLQLAVSSFANVFAVLLPSKLVTVFSNGALIVLWSFGGINPTKEAIDLTMSVFGTILYHISFFAPTHRLVMKIELSGYSEFWNTVKDWYSKIFELGSYSPSFNTESEAGYLLLYWFISNILTYLILVFQRDDYRMWKLFADRTGVYYIQRCFAYCLHRIETVIVDTNGAIVKCLKSKSNRKTDDNDTKIEVPRSKSDIVQSDSGITRQANIVIN